MIATLGKYLIRENIMLYGNGKSKLFHSYPLDSGSFTTHKKKMKKMRGGETKGNSRRKFAHIAKIFVRKIHGLYRRAIFEFLLLLGLSLVCFFGGGG